MSSYSRDLIGYGRKPPQPNWPNGARLAVQFVVNYEEGGENCVLHGDAGSEAFLSEIVGAETWVGQRHMNMESIYEFGARVGFWRLWHAFIERKLPVTCFGVATAMARNAEAVAAMKEAGWEIASHGLKWIDYRHFDEAAERSHILDAIRIHTEVTGVRPLGFYQGRTSANTLSLVMNEQGFLYSADSYADELPYWVEGPHGHHLIVPYTLDANDMRFATVQGFNSGDQFFAYLKDSFDVLYAEGGRGYPKMLSVGLHCRIAGRPGRAAALLRFLDYVQQHEQVWIASRIDIARHWVEAHPPKGGFRPSRMPRGLFVERFGDVFEHTPIIAEAAHSHGLTTEHDTVAGLHRLLVAALRALNPAAQLQLIRAHPDLAGRLAMLGKLTTDSRSEQSGAGLDRLSPGDLARFNALNAAYMARFEFPFIQAVRGQTKDEVLASFETRLAHDRDTEFEQALLQIEHIALHRLRDRLRT